MTREERQRLRLEWKMDPQGFAQRVEKAVLKEDWQFVRQASEVLKPKEFIPFREKVAAAYAQLFPAHGLNVTVPMIKEKVVAMFPETARVSSECYSRAFRELKLPPFKKKTRSK
jgi:hypothetical protein